VQDTELSCTPKGVDVCKFAVACNRFWKQDKELQKEVSFFDVTTWMRLAETCGEYLKKGRGVRVVGRLKLDRWTDSDGKARSRILIVAEHVEFKPQFKKGEGKDGEPGAAETTTEAADGQVQEEAELKEAASF
jgi:single-strand DNA-binding protein